MVVRGGEIVESRLDSIETDGAGVVDRRVDLAVRHEAQAPVNSPGSCAQTNCRMISALIPIEGVMSAGRGLSRHAPLLWSLRWDCTANQVRPGLGTPRGHHIRLDIRDRGSSRARPSLAVGHTYGEMMGT